MITYYLNHIDQLVLTFCVVFTFINTVRMVRRAAVPVRKVPAYFVVFGATSIATFLGAGHLFEISYRAIEQKMAGTFVYNFRFYALILLGVLLLSLSVQMLRYIRNWFSGVPDSQRQIIKTALIIVAISAPTGVFSPIGYVPTIACTITLLFMPFAVRKQPKTTQMELVTNDVNEPV
ncbi:hypothetical protein IC229_29920 [Spirosoma sp. BT702]|uniref:Uncharacterized protein n=1 Tax=Spirosoma profusum TaxID=2771354 RepID=A0A927G9R4_9BACT|nr:hypothetical protein [Spirosoma profusum]MBD2704887.1 hypothetical protein [Spirosoma profusum]